MGTIYRPNNTHEEVQPRNGRTYSLEELQAIVGEGAPVGYSYIEIIETRERGKIMVLNDAGRLIDLPRNEVATALVKLVTPRDLARMKMELGDRLILAGHDLEGEQEDFIAGTVLVCESREVR